MGNTRVTKQNLKVIEVDIDNNLGGKRFSSR